MKLVAKERRNSAGVLLETYVDARILIPNNWGRGHLKYAWKLMEHEVERLGFKVRVREDNES